MTQFKPLLSATCEDIRALRYPVLASPKLDGIRCLKIDGKAVSRKLKPIPNDFVREWIEEHLPDGIDGELLLRDPRAPFCEVSSAIMSKGGEPDFVFWAFDLFDPEEPDQPFGPSNGSDIHNANGGFTRLYQLSHWRSATAMCQGSYGDPAVDMSRIDIVTHTLCRNEEELRKLVADHIAFGFEGTMVRDPAGRYKFGRSTLKEQILCKIKAWADEEATVIGFVEQMHNENEATRDAVGNVKRSSAKAGKVGTGKLGALICKTEDGVEFEIGTGFTDAQRVEVWKEAQAPLALAGDGIVGHVVKFKHQPPPGGRKPGEAPRFPVFLGWRED